MDRIAKPDNFLTGSAISGAREVGVGCGGGGEKG